MGAKEKSIDPLEKLNDDAVEYANENQLGREGYVLAKGFRAGALSASAANGCNNHVEMAKIDFAIGQLNLIRLIVGTNDISVSYEIGYKISELTEKRKQYE